MVNKVFKSIILRNNSLSFESKYSSLVEFKKFDPQKLNVLDPQK